MSYTVDAHTYVSPNYDARPSGVAIDALVIHTTEGVWPSDAQWLCNPASQVSCHYVIPPSGDVIYRLVSDAKRAWHAGTSNYGDRSNWNNFSIGIEISHKQGQPWAAGQRDRTAELCRDLIAQYHIPQANIAAHRWVATPTGRKIDPTDWPDDDFNSWIASLYARPVRRYAVTSPCAVFTDRDTAAPLATGPHDGQTQLLPGDAIDVGDVTDGWLWIATGIGFIPQSYARPL